MWDECKGNPPRNRFGDGYEKIGMQSGSSLSELDARKVSGSPTQEYTRSSLFTASCIVSHCQKARPSLAVLCFL